MKKASIFFILSILIFSGCNSLQYQSSSNSVRSFHTPSDWKKPISKNQQEQTGISSLSQKETKPADTLPKEKSTTESSSSQTELARVDLQNTPKSSLSSSNQLKGIASWYGPGFHGKKTSSGEIYDQNAMTAAHKILPMHTWIRVTNTENKNKVILQINDRGPYKKGRVLDVTRKAASRLGFLEKGTTKISIEVLRYPPGYDPSKGLDPYKQTVVQIAVFTSPQRAQTYQKQLSKRYQDLVLQIDEPKKGFYHVIAGPYNNRQKAKSIALSLKKDGIDNFVRSYRK